MDTAEPRVCLGLEGSEPVAVHRGAALLLLFLKAAWDGVARFAWRDSDLRSRAAWLHRWSRLCNRVLGMKVHVSGSSPRHGVLVCNHLSYLDVLALSEVTPCIFVAKHEVSRWPLFGFFSRVAGTIYVDRTRRSDVARVNRLIDFALASGVLVVLFAEGTSSDGSTVLPFRSSLLEPVLARQCQVTAGAVSYSLGEGSVAEEVCYWGGMSLLPHLLNLLSKRDLNARLAFARLLPGARCRKDFAMELREAVIRLRT